MWGGGVVFVIGKSFKDFSSHLVDYQATLDAKVTDIQQWLRLKGFEVPTKDPPPKSVSENRQLPESDPLSPQASPENSPLPEASPENSPGSLFPPPVGMLLSAPLTMIAKIILASDEDAQWIALLMGARAPEETQT